MFNTGRPEKTYSVLIVADNDAARYLAGVLEFGTWGLRCLDQCCPRDEAVEAVHRFRPDVVVADLNLNHCEGTAVLERLCKAYPGLPVVVVSDAADGGSLRKAFLLGAFDYIVKPVTLETAGDLARRLRARLSRDNEGGVFSPARTELARHLLYGTTAGEGAHWFEEDWQSHSWVSVLVDVCDETAKGEIADVLDASLRDSEGLGIREFNHDRGVLHLTLLYHHPSPARAERMAANQGQDLVGALSAAGVWSAAGIGPAVPLVDLAASLQAARLAAGYALARGAGVYTYRGEQEFAGLPCPELGHYMDQFLSRIQSGGDWTELMDPFFNALRACSSARRLHQDVQLLFSGIADLVPLSPKVERFYHIVDFVHGPEALRAELEALCGLAGEARRANGRSLADRKLVEFQEYISQHYGDWHLDLAVVCSALQISPSYLSKILRRSLKLTFVEFVTEVRMARSRELLSSTDLLTSQIAEQVGYVYTHYFSAIFKKRYSITPSEFRTWCRTRVLESVTA